MTKEQLKRLSIVIGVIAGIAAVYLVGVAIAHTSGARGSDQWVLGGFVIPAAMLACAMSVSVYELLGGLVNWIRRG